MLTVKMGGKTVSTANNKQVMTINGNDVEIERIGNGIYVNGLPINVIIAEKKGMNWKVVLGGAFIGIPAGAAVVFGAVYLVPEYFVMAFDYVTTQGSTLVDLVMSYVS